MALFPFIILKNEAQKADVIFMTHEKIHIRQQAELLVIIFYLWYFLEFVIRIMVYKNRFKAYRNISFEREAYINEKDPDYLKSRPFFHFIKYL